MPVNFDTPIEYLKGVGPLRAETLKKELGIFTCGDLLYYFPFRYIDRSKFYKTTELTSDLPYVQLKGKVISLKEIALKKRKVLSGIFQDEFGGCWCRADIVSTFQDRAQQSPRRGLRHRLWNVKV
jgi:ATP-dependent DNA helicase RecG